MSFFSKKPAIPTEPIVLEITALTPPGKAKASKLMLESNLLGALKKPKSTTVKGDKITWIIECKDEKEAATFV